MNAIVFNKFSRTKSQKSAWQSKVTKILSIFLSCREIKGDIMVLDFCVGFQELFHLTRDLSQAEKKIDVVTS